MNRPIKSQWNQKLLTAELGQGCHSTADKQSTKHFIKLMTNTLSLPFLEPPRYLHLNKFYSKNINQKRGIASTAWARSSHLRYSRVKIPRGRLGKAVFSRCPSFAPRRVSTWTQHGRLCDERTTPENYGANFAIFIRARRPHTSRSQWTRGNTRRWRTWITTAYARGFVTFVSCENCNWAVLNVSATLSTKRFWRRRQMQHICVAQ